MAFSCVLLFFFFKQKTAYEMRISDWSSDVCSSDLCCARAAASATRSCWRPSASTPPTPPSGTAASVWWRASSPSWRRWSRGRRARQPRTTSAHDIRARGAPVSQRPQAHTAVVPVLVRSEEHTSELQSLMSIQYAVFCLEKKKHRKKYTK